MKIIKNILWLLASLLCNFFATLIVFIIWAAACTIIGYAFIRLITRQ